MQVRILSGTPMYYISIKTKDGFKHFPVSEEVYNYIRQLEFGIKFPYTKQRLKEEYPQRF